MFVMDRKGRYVWESSPCGCRRVSVKAARRHARLLVESLSLRDEKFQRRMERVERLIADAFRKDGPTCSR
jgi:hypothetical protein